MFDPPLYPDRDGFRRVEANWGSAQLLSLCVLDDGRIVSGVVAFGDGAVVNVSAIGIQERVRRRGIGRRLMDIVEAVALGGDYTVLALGA